VDKMSSLKDMAIREMNAGNNFITSLVEQFDLSPDQAEKVLTVFIKVKAVKLNRTMGKFELRHGAFWEKEVIERALNM
jgi:hypothetical protein